MKLTGIRERIFLDRYSIKDKKGDPTEKTPNEMWRRVARAVAQQEPSHKRRQWEKDFYEAMENFKYVPGGRILAGAGAGYSVSFYNCFVIPSPEDSRGGILETLKQMVEVMAHGGGVGINFSSLRPRGARVAKVNGHSSGPCNWAELFSVATKDIIQQGGTRRGALMLMLWDWHPDVEEFITVKQDLRRINGANLSVCVSDRFMEAVAKDKNWDLVFPDVKDPEYDAKWNGDLEIWKKLGKKVIVAKTIKARFLWDLIAKAAWRSAEPGVVFMERYNKLHNNYYWNRINCVNPCGEEGLPPWGVCNLGSINLSALVSGDDTTRKGAFDYAALKRLVRIAIRFQDNIVDMDPYIFEGIRQTQLEGERRTGLGTMGLGDALIKLHMRYGSDEALEFCDKVYRIIRDEAYHASSDNAKEKGSFGKFDKNLYLKGQFVKKLPKEILTKIKKSGIRNSILLMQAPTGTTSLLANTTSGIEPVYEFEFVRRDRLGTHIIRHHLYQKWYSQFGKELEAGKIKQPEWFVSANDLTPEEHIRIQGVIQKYVDASISKTVNAPGTHTVDDVKKLYTLAYKLGLKGIAYMREGSRPGVLERDMKVTKPEEKKAEVNMLEVKPRPMMVTGATYQIQTPIGKAYITINTNGNNEPLELFMNVGKAGSDVTAMAEGLGRLVSLNLRLHSHLPAIERVKQIIAELSGIGGSKSIGFGKDKVRSLPDAMAKVLANHFHVNNGNGHVVVTNGEVEKVSTQTQVQLQLNPPAQLYDFCPECREVSLAYEEGCKKCYSCGYSEC